MKRLLPNHANPRAAHGTIFKLNAIGKQQARIDFAPVRGFCFLGTPCIASDPSSAIARQKTSLRAMINGFKRRVYLAGLWCLAGAWCAVNLAATPWEKSWPKLLLSSDLDCSSGFARPR